MSWLDLVWRIAQGLAAFAAGCSIVVVVGYLLMLLAAVVLYGALATVEWLQDGGPARCWRRVRAWAGGADGWFLVLVAVQSLMAMLIVAALLAGYPRSWAL